MKRTIIIITILITHFQPFAQKLYSLDHNESVVHWKGFKPFDDHYGTVNFINGALNFEKNTLTGASFIVDMTTITIQDLKLKEEKAELLKDLTQPAFLHVMENSMALFELTEAEKINDGVLNYQITGNLTIKNKTNTITFPAQIRTAGNRLAAKATIVFDRQKWDLEMENMVKELAIYNDIELIVHIIAHKKK